MFLIMLSWPYGYPPYGREVNVNCWDKHPTGSLHAEFWRYILHIQIKIPTSAHQAELGRYPQKIYIKKRAITIFKHLNSSSPRQPAFQNPPNPKRAILDTTGIPCCCELCFLKTLIFFCFCNVLCSKTLLNNFQISFLS